MGQFFGHRITDRIPREAPNEMTFNPSTDNHCALAILRVLGMDMYRGLPWSQFLVAWRWLAVNKKDHKKGNCTWEERGHEGHTGVQG